MVIRSEIFLFVVHPSTLTLCGSGTLQHQGKIGNRLVFADGSRLL